MSVKLLTTKEVAKLVGIKQQSVQRYLRLHADELGVQRIGRDYLLTPEQFEKFKRRPGVGQGGPPRQQTKR